MSDLTLDALHSALRGLATRQRVTADNVANLETPGFLAGRVQFESVLRAAVARGEGGGVTPVTNRSLAATGVNGNNVKLEEETLASTETALRYQLAIEAVNAKFGLLRTAIGRGA